MRILVCTVDIDPCPPANVASIAWSDAVDMASLGITADEMAYVFSWGLASVIGMFCVGYAVASVVGMLRKL